MPLKTLFLNPPSFENFDGGAGSRWPATREIESFWYPVWLAYPAGMLEGARLLDAPAHHVSGEETINIAKDYEFLVLFTSTPGFPGDIRLAKAIKSANPKIKICFVGPHVSVLDLCTAVSNLIDSGVEKFTLKEQHPGAAVLRKSLNRTFPPGVTDRRLEALNTGGELKWEQRIVTALRVELAQPSAETIESTPEIK